MPYVWGHTILKFPKVSKSMFSAKYFGHNIIKNCALILNGKIDKSAVKIN
jgi:hypothetical protein